MNRIILVFFLVICLGFISHSTPQRPHLLKYKSDTIELYDSPIEDFHKLTKKIIHQQNQMSSGCWDGYYGLWEIKNDSLFLNSIVDCFNGENHNKLVEKVLKKKFVNGRIYADWFTDDLWGGHGYYYFFYSEELNFKIVKGKVINLNYYGQSQDYARINNPSNIHEYFYVNFPWDEIILEGEVEEYFNKIMFILDDNGKLIDLKFKKNHNQKVNSLAREVFFKKPDWIVYYYEGEKRVYDVEFEFKLNGKNYTKFTTNSNKR